MKKLTQSGEANSSCDGDEKDVNLVELASIDIRDFKDSTLFENGTVDAYNTSGMWFTIVLSRLL